MLRSINFITHLQGWLPSGNHWIWGCRLSVLCDIAASLLTEQSPVVYEYSFLYLNSNSWKIHKGSIKEFYICCFHFFFFFEQQPACQTYQLLLSVCNLNGPNCSSATLIWRQLRRAVARNGTRELNSLASPFVLWYFWKSWTNHTEKRRQRINGYSMFGEGVIMVGCS